MRKVKQKQVVKLSTEVGPSVWVCDSGSGGLREEGVYLGVSACHPEAWLCEVRALSHPQGLEWGAVVVARAVFVVPRDSPYHSSAVSAAPARAQHL